VSTRLTGGPANSGCLSSFEALGLGEGWSDFMAIAVRITSADTRETDYAWAAWATNNLRGGRAYPYSTSLRTNPLTYASVNDMNEMHAVGTVWASMLYEVLWNVVEKIGIDQQGGGKVGFDERGVLVDGRYLVMKLVMDGMAL
jgi:extracellular elastinolytic metalloproteinase